jgi:hypothetical protein
MVVVPGRKMVYRVIAVNQLNTFEDILGCCAPFEDAPSLHSAVPVEHVGRLPVYLCRVRWMVSGNGSLK